MGVSLGERAYAVFCMVFTSLLQLSEYVILGPFEGFLAMWEPSPSGSGSFTAAGYQNCEKGSFLPLIYF